MVELFPIEGLSIIGSAKVGEKEIVREAVPAEDRMQAFLWRHLVPANDLKVLVFDPGYEPPPKHLAPIRPPSVVSTNTGATTNLVATSNSPALPKLAATTNGLATTNVQLALKTASPTNLVAGTNTATNAVASAAKPKFTKQQIIGRLKQLKLLFEEGLLTESFYCERVAECEATP